MFIVLHCGSRQLIRNWALLGIGWGGWRLNASGKSDLMPNGEGTCAQHPVIG
jgi:hypothetical protein